MAQMQGEQFTVVWRTPTLRVVSRIQHVADAEAAVLAVQIDRGSSDDMEVVAVFKGWPEQADDFDDGDWLDDEDEPMSNETIIVQDRV
jgi:hypothetical protein